jgi:hypothetical protein
VRSPVRRRLVVDSAYRDPGESSKRAKAFKKGKGARAAPGWASCHNYGLAIDVYLFDAASKLIETPRKGWYAEYKKLAAHMKPQGFEWGEPINDTDHFEYHPSWKGLAGGAVRNSTLTRQVWRAQHAGR